MSQSDSRLLFSIPNVTAYHVQDGNSTSLNPSGPQQLSLSMITTTSSYANDGTPEEDFFLHLSLPPELDLPLPATTRIYHQPPSSYLIPRDDAAPDSGIFTRIEFSEKARREDVETFETILAQCTTFHERAPAPVRATASRPEKGSSLPAYDPSSYAQGQAYAAGSSAHHGGQIVLIDEENGSVVGELGDGFDISEDSAVQNGSKSEYIVYIVPTSICSLPSYNRSCRNNLTTRRAAYNRRRTGVTGVSGNGYAPSLQEFDYSQHSSYGIPFHCRILELHRKAVDQPS